MKIFYSIFLSFIFVQTLVAQCPSGSIGMSAGGCLAGCDLTSFGGPNCGAGTSGNVDGQTPVTLDIVVPNGCTYTVTIRLENRPGCSSSGADGFGTAGEDRIKVDVLGGVKPFVTGGSNSSITDNFTLTGPGTIRLTLRSNRQDEILTYIVTSSGSLCTNCTSTLPVTLISYTGKADGDDAVLEWETVREIDNDYFTLLRSRDGAYFEPIYQMDGAGNHEGLKRYTVKDIDAQKGVNYYRLTQTDFDGKITDKGTISVVINGSSNFDLMPNPANSYFTLTHDSNVKEYQTILYNEIGQEVKVNTSKNNSYSDNFDVSNLQSGIYFLKIITDQKVEILKFQKN